MTRDQDTCMKAYISFSESVSVLCLLWLSLPLFFFFLHFIHTTREQLQLKKKAERIQLNHTINRFVLFFFWCSWFLLLQYRFCLVYLSSLPVLFDVSREWKRRGISICLCNVCWRRRSVMEEKRLYPVWLPCEIFSLIELVSLSSCFTPSLFEKK